MFPVLRNRQQVLEDLWQQQGLSGHALLARHTQLVDAFLCEQFQAAPAVRQAGGAIVLIALGGYGRSELYPFSDIDLLLLHDRAAEKKMREAAESVLYPLWDAGFAVGHSVRTVKDAVRFAGEDYLFQVALLDARLLTGSEALFQDLLNLYRKKVIEGSRDKFVRTMHNLRAERRQKYGTHSYLLEPQIKEGKGGLRDIQAMLWTAKAVFGLDGLTALEDSGMLTAEERSGFATAWDMLISIRVQLHRLSRRQNDRLFFEYQEELAAVFGCQDQDGMRAVEHFMRQVYSCLQTVAVTTDLFFEQVQENLRLGGKDSREQELEQGIVVRAGSLRLTAADALLAQQPHLLLRLFFHAGRSGLPVHHRTRQMITRSLHLADEAFRSSKRTAKTFTVLLLAENPLPALETMLETGLLTAYLPEFAKVESLAQHDLYHICTVDRHQLQTVAELAKLRRTEAELSAAVAEPQLLCLAGLLHDIGKGRGADHSVLGAELVSSIGLRLGLDSNERERLAFLVRWHLFLPENALRRDLSDHAFIREAARLIGDQDMLTMLYLLSIADSKATGPSAWSDWKATLLAKLFLKVRACLESGCTAEEYCGQNEAQGAAWLREQAAARLKPGEAINMPLAELPADYLTSFNPEEVAQHLRLHRDQAALLQQKVLLFPEERQGHWSLLILCTDRHGLLAKICGVLALHSLSVLAAKIFTWPDGTVVDVLDVTPIAALEFADQNWQALENDLNRAVNYRLDVGLQLHNKLETLSRKPAVQLAKTEAVISNAASDQYTVIEVYGCDHLGALYQLTQTLSDFRLSIHRARIATEVEQLIDVFYVTTEDRRKVEDAALLAEINHALLHVIGGKA
ncbi:MAG: UTP--GlnB (protein PII) uridylyltransferase, GlnD [Candidatus Electronema aureum]|uniref:Bifunctional uridylyltransferase/uridylyl-removing enzyme n=1 Tax=Candidatus Electronema aureum TaxID=2005002 RepID=A0A521G166_9BACT|nr:MAG: UTP--GlnB (protein PII) uridylyltransferase, GlnD [Candidatus Electronema aureum]